MASEQTWADARRRLNRLDRAVTFVERGQGTGRNWNASQRSAAANLTGALKAIVAIEDTEGVAAAALLSTRATQLRQAAVRCGLLTLDAVGAAEREATA